MYLKIKARIEGNKDNYSAYDVFKTGHDAGGWGGKSLGIVSVNKTLYLFRNGTGSTGGAFKQTELWKSTDHAKSWTFTGIKWTFSGMPAFYSPTFLQFGKDYQNARDQYVYIYANEAQKSDWNVQKPGGISLIRVPKNQIESFSAYEYFTGFDSNNQPTWSKNLSDRKPVFQDPNNGNMRTSISYNAGLKRYLLITQQVNRFASNNYHIGVYEAPEPWGPWKTVLFNNPQNVGPGLNTGPKTVYWNFSNKWLSPDGRHFVLVYTGPGPDEWGTVEGDFILKTTQQDTTPPSAPSRVKVSLIQRILRFFQFPLVKASLLLGGNSKLATLLKTF
ncbi:MAG: DUF4185 domain-containing protein [Bdellovibrio sp.]|nr:MAG: DUF4185 domain-containing protein [Bdellovibrio sp.]